MLIYKTLPFLVQFAFPHRAEYERLFGVSYCDCPMVPFTVQENLIKGIVDQIVKTKAKTDSVRIMSFGSGFLGNEFMIYYHLKALGYTQVTLDCVDLLYVDIQQLKDHFKNQCHTKLEDLGLDQPFELAVEAVSEEPVSFLPFYEVKSKRVLSALGEPLIDTLLVKQLKAFGILEDLKKRDIPIHPYSSLEMYGAPLSGTLPRNLDIVMCCDVINHPQNKDFLMLLTFMDLTFHKDKTQGLSFFNASRDLMIVKHEGDFNFSCTVNDKSLEDLDERYPFVEMIQQQFSGWCFNDKA